MAFGTERQQLSMFGTLTGGKAEQDEEEEEEEEDDESPTRRSRRITGRRRRPTGLHFIHDGILGHATTIAGSAPAVDPNLVPNLPRGRERNDNDDAMEDVRLKLGAVLVAHSAGESYIDRPTFNRPVVPAPTATTVPLMSIPRVPVTKRERAIFEDEDIPTS